MVLPLLKLDGSKREVCSWLIISEGWFSPKSQKIVEFVLSLPHMFTLESEAKSKSIVTPLRAFSRPFCKLCAYLLWVFTCVWSVVALVYALQYQLSCTSLRPLFGIVLANPCARTPFVLWVTDMIWAVYLMFRVANYKAPYKRSRWPLLHSTAPQMPTLRLFEKMNLNKDI